MQPDLRNDPRYQNHERRPDLAGEHPLGDTLQAIGMFLFIGAIVLDLFLPGNPQKNQALLAIWVRLPVSIMLVALGGWMALRGIKYVFGEYRPEPVMLTGWLFAFMRHPIYLGAILIYLGVLLVALSPWAGLVFLAVLALYQWLAWHEEKMMMDIFGEAYRAYQRRVPMWLPIKIVKKNHKDPHS